MKDKEFDIIFIILICSLSLGFFVSGYYITSLIFRLVLYVFIYFSLKGEIGKLAGEKLR